MSKTTDVHDLVVISRLLLTGVEGIGMWGSALRRPPWWRPYARGQWDAMKRARELAAITLKKTSQLTPT